MREEHFKALVSFLDAINTDLGHGQLMITRQRLFVLLYLCTHPRDGVTSHTIAAAVRTLPAQWADGCVGRLRFPSRVYRVLRLLRRAGLITRVETRPGRNHKYYPTQRTQSGISAFVHKAMYEEHEASADEQSQQHA